MHHFHKFLAANQAELHISLADRSPQSQTQTRQQHHRKGITIVQPNFTILHNLSPSRPIWSFPLQDHLPPFASQAPLRKPEPWIIARHVFLHHHIERLALRLRVFPDLPRAKEPDYVRDEDPGFKEETQDVDHATENVKGVLRDWKRGGCVD